MKKAYLQTSGCQMNEHDSEHMIGLLRGEGYSLATSPDEVGEGSDGGLAVGGRPRGEGPWHGAWGQGPVEQPDGILPGVAADPGEFLHDRRLLLSSGRLVAWVDGSEGLPLRLVRMVQSSMKTILELAPFSTGHGRCYTEA